LFILLLKNNYFSQELLFEDGLFYEKPNYTDNSFGKYTKDNISYKSNCTFIYDYYYIDNLGGKKKFLKSDAFTENNPMNLIDYRNIDERGIDKIKLTVNDRLALNFPLDSSYTQTIICYDYLDKSGKTEAFSTLGGEEITGVIDNNKNLWLHPPRSYTFKILELNPFPFY